MVTRTVAERAHTLCDIPIASLSFQRDLGSGSFGVVRLAIWRDGDGAVHDVAVKGNVVDCVGLSAIENEGDLYKVLLRKPQHRNVVTVRGLCRDDAEGNLLLVMDYYPSGGLDDFLRKQV